jgi:TRAP-type C4-dicarboxylate transport system substrate-binding protein
MKKKSLFIITLFLLLVLAACNSETSGGEKSKDSNSNNDKKTITLKFASPSPTESPYAKQTVEPFMDRVTELTDGQVQWDYYPAQQLGSMMDHITLTRDGVADVAYFAALNFRDEFPISSSLAGLPGLGITGVEDSLAFHDVVQKSPILEKDFLSNGVYPVMVQVAYPFEFITRNKPIRVPADMKGIQMMGNGGMMNALLEHLGATPVSLTTAEMFEAFDRGVVEAVHAVPSTANAYGLGDLAKYSTKGTGAGAGPVGFMMNAEVWEGLPKDIQEAFNKAAREISVSGMGENEADSAKVLEDWKSNGIEVEELTAEEKKQWDKTFVEFREKWVKQQGKEFAEAYDLYTKALKKYQK